MNAAALILASGKSERLPGAVRKQYRPLAGIPVLAHTLQRFENCASIGSVTLCVPEEDSLYVSEAIVDRFKFRKVTKIVPGKSTRTESVRAALAGMAGLSGTIVLHDGVRPLVEVDLIERVIETCQKTGAAATSLPISDSVKRAEGGIVLATLDGARLHTVQTPQAYEYDILVRAYRDAEASALESDDDSAIVEASGQRIELVMGSRSNIKIEVESDLELARFYLTSK